MSGIDAVLGARLRTIEAQDRLRRRVPRVHHGAHVVSGGKRLLNFCSNDYLGLATERYPQRAAGSGASALVTGYSPEVAELESAIADYLGRERALVFSSGFAANIGVIDALIGKNDLAVCDALNHASLIDGVRLSGARKVIVPHADIDAMAAALAQSTAGQRLLVSDAVFSMDGDCADAVTLAEVAQQADAWLMLDDAHGFGVMGDGGRGVAARLDQTQLPVLMGTLGKSVGASGAFVAGSGALIDYLVNRARTQIFSTAMAPATALAANAGLSAVRSDDWRREQLFERIGEFQRGVARLGLNVVPSNTPIQPVLIGRDADALLASRVLEEAGCLVAAIRPPTVPEGTARLRITLSAAHSKADIEALLLALARIAE